jgi:ABC-type multidrug transport system ATPase subunit
VSGPLFEARGLVKAYPLAGKPKPKLVIDDVDLRIDAGMVYGLMGLTGAGKSTLVGMLCGLVIPTAGEILVEGVPASAEQLRASVMLALGNDLGFYKGISVTDNLIFFGALFGMERAQAQARAAEVLEMVSLSKQAASKYGSLSSGQKRQCHLARALLLRRPLLIADEPTRGLDPATEQTIVDLLLKIKAGGQAMLVVTHDVHLAATLCDWVGILEGGQIIREGTPLDLLHLLSATRIYIRFHDEPAEAIRRLEKLIHLTEIHHHDQEVHVYTTAPEDDINDVVQILVETKLRIAHIDLPEPSLEEVFLKVVAERKHEAAKGGAAAKPLPASAPPAVPAGGA